MDSNSAVPPSVSSASSTEVAVWADLEELVDLVEHLSMLCGREHAHVRPSLLAQRVDYRCHLDGFGSRANDDEDALGL